MKLLQRFEAPGVATSRGRWATRACVIACVAVSSLAGVATAQPRKKAPAATAPAAATPPGPTPSAGPGPGPAPAAKPDGGKGDKKERVQNIDLTGIDLNAHNRTPQLLYFLERANE